MLTTGIASAYADLAGYYQALDVANIYEVPLAYHAEGLDREVLDAFYEAGCGDALIGMRGGVAYAEFCREAASLRDAVLSAIRDVESAGVRATVKHVELDKFFTFPEIARRLHVRSR